MATPTDPTATTIVTEAWKTAGNSSPSSAELTRATDEWLQEIFNDIWLKSVTTGNTRLKTLEETLIDVSVRGKRFMDLAEDFDEELEISILDGTIRGTAQTGGASSITLASGDSQTAAGASGKQVLITGGTGENGLKEIISYSTSTKVATMDSAWTTPPDLTSTYLIVGRNWGPLDEVHISELDALQPLAEGRPTQFAKYNRQIIFDRPFDLSTYGIQMRYFMNIHQVDLTTGSSTRITRIYRNWQDVLKQGVLWKCLRFLDDTRYVGEKLIFENKVAALLAKELPYGGEFTGFSL